MSPVNPPTPLPAARPLLSPRRNCAWAEPGVLSGGLAPVVPCCCCCCCARATRCWYEGEGDSRAGLGGGVSSAASISATQ